MLELALRGSRGYWTWLGFLAVVLAGGLASYIYQFQEGLMVTGLHRDVSWGFYIAQLTFLVGVAASAVMVILPYYLHHYKDFGRITILGEFLAIPAVIMAMLFVAVDLGKPERLLNMIIHASPNSILVWDFMVLNAYLVVNLLVGWTVLQAERLALAPPKWVKPLIYLSIPLAVSIHTVTAFLYAGLPGRGYWLTAIMAPRFLASAFAAGPAVLILLALLLKRLTGFDAGKRAVQSLAKIVCYGIILHIFFFGLEVFTVFYSRIPDHMSHFIYLYAGLHGKSAMVPWVWSSLAMGLCASVILLVPAWRQRQEVLGAACVLVFAATWIDKGLGMMAGGYIPNPLHEVTEYFPTWVELSVSAGIYALGALVLTLLYRLALGVKRETSGMQPGA